MSIKDRIIFGSMLAGILTLIVLMVFLPKFGLYLSLALFVGILLGLGYSIWKGL